MPVAIVAAIAGSALASAAGSAIAGHQAASATRDAANTAAGVQLAALGQQRQLAAPYTALGQAAIPQLKNLLGLGPQGAGGVETALRSTPGYQFSRQEGISAINNASTLGSGPLSTGTLTGLETFGSNLADRTLQTQIGDIFNTVGLGQAAAAGQAANIGNAAGNLSQIAQTQGTNLANIDINQIAGISKAFGSAGQDVVTLAALNNTGSGSGLGIGG